MQFNPHGVVIEGREQFAIGANNHSVPLEAGEYAVWAAADTYIKVAETADDVTSTSGYLVKGGASPIFIRIGRDGYRIGATTAAFAHRVA